MALKIGPRNLVNGAHCGNSLWKVNRGPFVVNRAVLPTYSGTS